jgi:phosphoesterase RecJ-like protein
MSIFTLDVLEQELSGVKKVAVTGHIRPDGDCIGSCSAMYQYLMMYGKELGLEQVDVYLETFGREFDILPGLDTVRHTADYDDTYDVLISLDCSSVDRLGDFIKYFNSAKRTICIDHHITNDNFAHVNHVVPDASSTCEVIYDLMDYNRITKDIATSLYIGIVHDTGMFRHSSTSDKTMQIAGSLMRKGVDFTKLIDETFIQKTHAQMQVMGRALMDSELLMDGKIILSVIGLDTMNSFNVTYTDLDGIIDQLRMVKDAEVAVFIYETGNGVNKISLRSNGIVNVSKIAHFFGGGGHVKAAGFCMEGTANDVIEKIMPYIEEQLKDK